MLIAILIIQGKRKIYCTILSFIFISLLDAIIGVFFLLGSGVDIEVWLQTNAPSHLVTLFTVSVLFIFLLIKQRWSGKVQPILQQIPQWMYVAGIVGIYALGFVVIGGQYISLTQFEGKQSVLLLFSMSSIAILIVVVLLGFVVVFYHKRKIEGLLKENIKLTEQRNQYDLLKQEKEKEIKKMLHDMKHHVQILHLFTAKKDYEALEKYLTELQPRVYALNMGLETGHRMTNVIANHFMQKCQEENIKFRWIGVVPVHFTLSDLDMSTIFFNLLSNAYEACIRMKQKNKREIIVEIKSLHSHTMFIVSNAMEGKVQIKNGYLQTSKKNKENHGFGHLNIQEIVEKNHGNLKYQIQENNFLVELFF